MLGLNISSAFNSAVTIYILIPILIIPQLLLSGVVISFDKFNPSVGKPVGIPVAGEMMASRWAFEAFMVTQFRDNPFEKQFYDLDKVVYESDYKRIYYIPTLESRLAWCLNHRSSWRNPNNKEMVGNLDLLRNEIGYELAKVGRDRLPEVSRLVLGKFDSTVYAKTSRFLDALKVYYANKTARASDEKERRILKRTGTPDAAQQFNDRRTEYVNEAVSNAVKNISAVNRIVEYDGKLIQNFYPIYMDEHRPSNVLDFSANLYQPTKHFAGAYIDTLYFNIGVIWTMTVFLFVTLYFDLLRKFIKVLEGQRRYRRRGER
jgi:hypothetical protein